MEISLAKTIGRGSHPARLAIFKFEIAKPLRTLKRTSPTVTLWCRDPVNFSSAIAFNFEGGYLMGMMMAAATRRMTTRPTKIPPATSTNLRSFFKGLEDLELGSFLAMLGFPPERMALIVCKETWKLKEMARNKSELNSKFSCLCVIARNARRIGGRS